MELNLTSDIRFYGDTMCSWHPLTKYVNYVLKQYTALTQEWPSKRNFIEKLEYLKENYIYFDKETQRIFEPLNITCFDNLVLFKYKGIIELEDLGYNYEDFFSIENGLYKECRSVVFDETNGCIAMASLAKFKNYGEDSDSYKQWSEQRLNQLYNSSFKYYITNKMDGSYQQYTYDKYRNRIIGSGSQGLDKDNVDTWRLKYGFELLTKCNKFLIKNFPDWTFIYEFIHPDNPIVVHYTEKDRGLYLIGARNKYTGQEMDLNTLSHLVSCFNSDPIIYDKKDEIKMVQWYSNETLESILSQLDKYSSNEKEGWVVDCWNGDLKFNHLRFKVKVNDYILMHRALSKNISPNAIIQCLAENKWDDLCSKIPVAYKDYADKLKKEILNYQYIIENTYKRYIEKLIMLNEEDFHNKKEAMLWITKNVPKFLRSYVINFYLNRDSNILKNYGGGYRKRNELKELAEKCKKLDI